MPFGRRNVVVGALTVFVHQAFVVELVSDVLKGTSCTSGEISRPSRFPNQIFHHVAQSLLILFLRRHLARRERRYAQLAAQGIAIRRHPQHGKHDQHLVRVHSKHPLQHHLAIQIHVAVPEKETAFVHPLQLVVIVTENERRVFPVFELPPENVVEQVRPFALSVRIAHHPQITQDGIIAPIPDVGRQLFQRLFRKNIVRSLLNPVG